MKKVAIVYTSKFGHTKQYADWLLEHIGKDEADVINVAGFNPTQLLAYKLIIFASCVYGDKMPIMDFVKKNIMGISTAKTMFLAVSWYTNDSEEGKQKLIDENYPDQFKGKVPLYVVNSGIDKKKISVADKAKLLASQVMIEKKDGRSNDDINILAIMKGYSDSTSAENLDSIKKGIEEFFNPPKKEEPKPVPKAEPAPVPKPAPAPIPAPLPEVKAEPAPKPMAASEMTSDADALSSLENAFKALKAPKPEPAPAPKPVEARKATSDADALASLEDAFKALSAPKPAPAAAPVVEAKSESAPMPKSEPVVEAKPEPAPKPVQQKTTQTQKEIASSVKNAIRAMNNGSLNTNYSPAPTFSETKSNDGVNLGFSIDEKSDDISTIGNADLYADAGKSWDFLTRSVGEEKTEPAVEVKPEPVVEVKPEPVVEVKPEPVVEVKPEPVVEAKSEPASDAAQKNSYMELFAKRRRKAEEENSEIKSETVAEAKPEPVVVKPVRVEKPAATEHASAVDVLSEFDFISETAKPEPVAPSVRSVSAVETTAAVDMDVYDFMDSSKPKASSRALNAVQDLAKAKAKAEEEAAKKAAEEAAAKEAEKSAPAVNNDFIAQMKKDMEALVEESQHELEIGNVSMNEDESEEIDGFTFSNDIDYDLSEIEIDTPPIGEVSLETIHKFDDEPKRDSTDLDLKKLQEEINASIESNKANKEKMLSRHAKKPKEEVHNPFAVQFDEDESKSKKKKKGAEIGTKRLDDPLDPDVFFSRPTRKTSDWNMPSETMPEIKFRR
ncbi:MAG: hypothetical protein IKK42_09060 [Oscillospiraceae bacterium]|nr:hypothetical protein [Oscillospiraceae bacterium]